MHKKNLQHQTHGQTQKSSWLLHVFFILFGLLFLLPGAAALKNGALWKTKATSGASTPSFEAAVSFVGMGAILVLMGALPWNWISERLERRKD